MKSAIGQPGQPPLRLAEDNYAMNTTQRFLIVGLIFCMTSVCPGEDAKLSVVYTGKVSALSLPASALGEDWIGPNGLVIDDFHDLSKYSGDVKPVVDELKKQLPPIGVVGTADFTYRRKSNPLQQITLRVFLFDGDAACRRWWVKKYRYDGWEKHYTVVSGVPYDAVDSTQMTKRAVAFGNIWMTCGALDKTEDHIKVLELYINKIKSVAGGK